MSLSNLKRFTNLSEMTTVTAPVEASELSSRQTDYLLLSPKQFATKYRDVLFRPVHFTFGGLDFDIQVNGCTNPFCKWFGLPQKRFEDVKNKPSRYRISGSDASVACNPDPTGSKIGMTWSDYSGSISNWSVAEELAYRIAIENVVDWTPEYEFHRETCLNAGTTPFDHPALFYKQGKSKANSQRWQCKTCKKMTNVLPSQRRSFSYNQKRNDILVQLAKLLVNRMPVRRACDFLGIGAQTYYNKLEWLYRRCLEFLERHEKVPLSEHQFDTLWIDTDQFQYFLNNIKRRGQGGGAYFGEDEPPFETKIVVSCDIGSRYVFRADVAYDWLVKLDQIEQDTITYKDDHLSLFARKNARFNQWSYAPQPPTKNDTQSQRDYEIALRNFSNRAKYTEGLHVNPTYTAIAHFWLMRNMLTSKEWRFISDADSSLTQSLYRVFAPEIRRAEAHHFLCQLEPGKSREQAYREHVEARKDLDNYARSLGVSRSVAAKKILSESLKTHTFHEEVTVDGKVYRKRAKRPIRHPFPPRDRGYYTVDCTTDLSAYSSEEVADVVLRVNNHSRNAFMQMIRRRLLILERPLVTARGDGKSYIYSNFNPKYAQYVVTILRTYYNFCVAYKSGGKRLTPAQRLGIADKQYDLKDIVYFS